MKKLCSILSAALLCGTLFAAPAWEKPLREQLALAKAEPTSVSTLQRMSAVRQTLAEDDRIPFMLGEAVHIGLHINDFPEKTAGTNIYNRSYAWGHLVSRRDALLNQEAVLVQIPFRPYADLFSSTFPMPPDDLALYTPTLFDFFCWWALDTISPELRQPLSEQLRASTIRRGLLLPEISTEAGILMNDFQLKKRTRDETGKALLDLIERPGVRGGEAEACVLLAWARLFADGPEKIKDAIQRVRTVAQTQISRDECDELLPPSKPAS